MEKLIRGTTAYKTFSNDVDGGRLSHAYMLHFTDAKNMRAALKIFALKFFRLTEKDTDGRRVLNGSFTDCRIYPAEEGKKITADAISSLLDDSALRPAERDRKLYIICGFEQASALIQNKLLKTLEEPPAGVHFLLGVTSLAPVLDTVKSRVKTLTVPPFTEREIFEALERKGANPLNADAAKTCAGDFGAAENMVGGGWFKEVVSAAEELCSVADISGIGAAAIKYGDTKYKTELLTQMQANYYSALCGRNAKLARLWQKGTLIYALESVDKACADVKFNAFFQGLLYDLMLRIIEEESKWSRLRE